MGKKSPVWFRRALSESPVCMTLSKSLFVLDSVFKSVKQGPSSPSHRVTVRTTTGDGRSLGAAKHALSH